MNMMGVYLPDALRAVGIVIVSYVLVFMPRAIRLWVRPRRTWELVIGIELLMIGGAGIMLRRWGHPLLAYGSPLIMAGGAFLALYITRAIWIDNDSERATRNRLRESGQ